jgi:hypothetical protein
MNLNRLSTHLHVLEFFNVLFFRPCRGSGCQSMHFTRNVGLRTEVNYDGQSVAETEFFLGVRRLCSFVINSKVLLDQGCKTPWRSVDVASEFCTVAPRICGSSVWSWFRITLLTPRNVKCLLDFRGNLCTPDLQFRLIKHFPVSLSFFL